MNAEQAAGMIERLNVITKQTEALRSSYRKKFQELENRRKEILASCDHEIDGTSMVNKYGTCTTCLGKAEYKGKDGKLNIWESAAFISTPKSKGKYWVNYVTPGVFSAGDFIDGYPTAAAKLDSIAKDNTVVNMGWVDSVSFENEVVNPTLNPIQLEDKK